jgi:hypothetical protein
LLGAKFLLPFSRPLALSSALMGRYLLRIVAGTTFLIILLLGVRAVRTSRQQINAASITEPDNTVIYFIADGTGHKGFHAGDQELALWALQQWQKTLGKTIHFVAGPEQAALVRLYWADPQEGQFGEMSPIAVGGLRGAAVFIRPDVESLGPEISKRSKEDPLLRDSIVYLTCLHELGHALGLSHSQNYADIMYYFGYGGDIVEYFERYRGQLKSRTDIQSVSGLSSGDETRIRTMYAQQ